jgi:HNH endonuclease
LEVKRYPEDMTGSELRRQLGIKKKRASRKNYRANKKRGRLETAELRRLFSPLIEKFWGKFRKTFTPEGKIELLREMAQVVLPNPIAYAVRRKGSRKKVGGCLVCAEFGFHNHHIIQVKNGGPNDRRNLMVLCEGCHRQVHPWMPAEDLMESMRETMERVGREL